MLQKRLQSTVKVSKAKGHATDAMVAGGRDRKEDKEGNDAADIAADFGTLRQPEVVNDARRHLLRVQKEMVSAYAGLVRVHGCHFQGIPQS